MSIKRTIRLMTIVSVLLAGANIGCGSGNALGGGSSNNDQGTSFLAFGYFGGADGGTGATGFNTFLSVDNNNNPDFNGVIGTTPFDGRIATVFIGLQNRLSSQFIQVTRIDCDYTVPGSDPSLQIPSESFNTGSVIASSGDGVVNPAAGSGSTDKIEFPMLTPDLFSFLNVNRNLLPEVPFRMILECRAVGITQAGDVLVTNQLPFTVFFFDTAACCTGTNNNGTALEHPGVLGGFQNVNGGNAETFSTGNGSASATPTATIAPNATPTPSGSPTPRPTATATPRVGGAAAPFAGFN